MIDKERERAERVGRAAIQSRTSSTQDAWKAGAKLAGDRTEDA